jgi:hypothetical protein
MLFKWQRIPIYTGYTQKNGAVSIVKIFKTAPFFCVYYVYTRVFRCALYFVCIYIARFFRLYKFYMNLILCTRIYVQNTVLIDIFCVIYHEI